MNRCTINSIIPFFTTARWWTQLKPNKVFFLILNLGFRVGKSGTSGGEEILGMFPSTCSQSLEEKKWCLRCEMMWRLVSSVCAWLTWRCEGVTDVLNIFTLINWESCMLQRCQNATNVFGWRVWSDAFVFCYILSRHLEAPSYWRFLSSVTLIPEELLHINTVSTAVALAMLVCGDATIMSWEQSRWSACGRNLLAYLCQLSTLDYERLPDLLTRGRTLSRDSWVLWLQKHWVCPCDLLTVENNQALLCWLDIFYFTKTVSDTCTLLPSKFPLRTNCISHFMLPLKATKLECWSQLQFDLSGLYAPHTATYGVECQFLASQHQLPLKIGCISLLSHLVVWTHHKSSRSTFFSEMTVPSWEKNLHKQQRRQSPRSIFGSSLTVKRQRWPLSLCHLYQPAQWSKPGSPVCQLSADTIQTTSANSLKPSPCSSTRKLTWAKYIICVPLYEPQQSG